MKSVLSDRNRMLGKGTWTDEGGTFAASPPLANLGTMQSPGPRAEFTGTTAEFSFAALDAADAAETFTVQSLGLIGHELPDGALIEWRRSDGSLIAAQTWRKFGARKNIAVIFLPAAVTLDTIHCKITNVASGTYGIAAAWAGELIDSRSERGWRKRGEDNSLVAEVDSTDWTFARTRRSSLPVKFPLLTYETAFGVPLPGTALAVPATWDTDNSTSESAGVYTFTSVAAGTLLAKTSALTSGEPHRITIELTQDAANAGTVTVNLGSDGAQALQPGTNTLVGNAADASLTIAATDTFTGTLEITRIEQLAKGLSKNDLESRLTVIGNSQPIIYAQRAQDQQWIASTAIYGRIDGSFNIEHQGGPYHQLEFSVKEMG